MLSDLERNVFCANCHSIVVTGAFAQHHINVSIIQKECILWKGKIAESGEIKKIAGGHLDSGYLP
jgi:hypothetical protein